MTIRRSSVSAAAAFLLFACGSAAQSLPGSRSSAGETSSHQTLAGQVSAEQTSPSQTLDSSRRNGLGASRPSTLLLPIPSIGIGEFEDAIGPGDPRDGDDRHRRLYELPLEAGQSVRLWVPAGEIDPMLRIESGDLRAENDDVIPTTLDAVIDFTAPVTARYLVTVTTAPPRQTGHFRLRVLERPATIGTPLRIGQPVEGTLSDAIVDTALGGGAAVLHFRADGGAILRLRVTSRAFDTVATVIGPTGERWMNDDANDIGDGTERALDSTIVLAVPTTGVYQLVVTSYGGAGRGPFRVTSSGRPAVVLRDGETSPSQPFAGPNGQGRVLGLYAGVTEYPDQQLYGCADDARFLGDAMRAAHLQREDEQIVLTDAQATRAAVLAGIRTMATRARPEDVVMLFWSGHGTTVVDTNQDELDGLDETIQLSDGPLTDDELVSALDAITANTILLALDSCHSGGFDRDFSTRLGRIGLYSSDEGVLSDVAESRRAGGYLAWHLRNAVLGRADLKPRDGVLYAGELTDYLHLGFHDDEALMNPAAEVEPAQHLLAHRETGWNQVLWVYPRLPDLSRPTIPSIPLESPEP